MENNKVIINIVLFTLISWLFLKIFHCIFDLSLLVITKESFKVFKKNFPKNIIFRFTYDCL